MGKKRQFIDKKNAVTFHLVHRSQKDPLIVDETAPQRVLLPVGNAAPGTSKDNNKKAKLDPEKQKVEQKKFGIYFEDDYDYLQHLRKPGELVQQWEVVENKKADNKEVSKKSQIQLPSSVFASEFEEDEGFLMKKELKPHFRVDLDPDVIAALDDDFDHENPDNELDDDFIDKAMGGELGSDYDDDDGDYEDNDSVGGAWSGESDDEEARDRVGPMRMSNFDNEETKSRFTEYSMTSSVIRRNAQLTLLDEKFEKFYENYDEPEIGALECEEIEGHIDINNDVLIQYAQQFHKKDKSLEYEKNWDTIRLTKLQEKSDESEEEMVELEVSDDEQKKWDCESVLSTYSNIYNHPKLIKEPSKRGERKIVINTKTGLPENVFDNEQKLTAKSLAKLDKDQQVVAQGPKSLCAESVMSTLSVLSIRPKDETPEEKRERKRLLKDYRQERRIERKANAEAFKEEKIRHDKLKINTANNRGNRIV